MKKQKRLVLMDLNVLYASFKESHPNEVVSYIVSVTLRSEHCIHAGARETHTVCVCTVHEGPKLMLDSININQLTNGKLCDYKDCLNKLMCEKPTPNCHLNNCDSCPVIADFRKCRQDVQKYLKSL